MVTVLNRKETAVPLSQGKRIRSNLCYDGWSRPLTEIDSFYAAMLLAHCCLDTMTRIARRLPLLRLGIVLVVVLLPGRATCSKNWKYGRQTKSRRQTMSPRMGR